MRTFFTPKRILIGLGACSACLCSAPCCSWCFSRRASRWRRWSGRSSARRTASSRLPARSISPSGPRSVFRLSKSASPTRRGFAEGSQILEADRIVFAVALIPLLGGDIQVKSLILEGADLRLAAQADGAVDWTFPTDETEERATLEDLRLDDVRLVGSRISFDAGDGKGETVLENADASLSVESLDKPGSFKGAFDYRGERANFDLGIGLPRAVIEQGVTPIKRNCAAMRSTPISMAISTARPARSREQLRANGVSLRDLMAWMGSPMPAGDGFGRLPP